METIYAIVIHPQLGIQLESFETEGKDMNLKIEEIQEGLDKKPYPYLMLNEEQLDKIRDQINDHI